ncbi:MAG: sugar transferase [bacterium]|nr:sugar transferase [bacterium]
MKRVELLFAFILVPLDYLALIAAGAFAYFIRFQPFFTELRPVVFDLRFPDYFRLVTLIAIVWLPLFAFAGLYRIRVTRRVVDELRRTTLACSTGVLGVVLFIFFQRELFSSRFILIAVWVLSIFFVFCGRLFILLLERLLFVKGIGMRNVVIVGGDKTTKDILRLFREKPRFGFRVVAHVPLFSTEAYEKLDYLVSQHRVDEIIQTGADVSREASAELLSFAEEHHITFKYIADLFATHARNIAITTIAGTPIVEIHRTSLDGWGKIGKRIFDIVISFLLLVFLSPVLFIVAVSIILESGFPVFFRRLDDGSPTERIGEHGKSFLYFKFRSMRDKVHSLRYTALADRNMRKGGPLVKIKNDPRLTRVGRFIRRFSLDELPELFLVLRGDMSLVGPRPHLPEEVAQYEKHHKRVLTIKPGITGLAQISGRSDLTFDEEVRIDSYYIENWTMWLDIYILLKTPFAVLARREAE